MTGVSHLLPLWKLFHGLLQLGAFRLAGFIRQLYERMRKSKRERLEDRILDSVAGTDGWRSPREVRSGQHLAVLLNDIGLREQLLQSGSGRRHWLSKVLIARALEIRHRFRAWQLPSEREIEAAMSSLAKRRLLYRAPSPISSYRLNSGT
jgi:hypothetical protein